MKKVIRRTAAAACLAFFAFGQSASAQNTAPDFDRLPLFGQPKRTASNQEAPIPSGRAPVPSATQTEPNPEPDWQTRNPSLERRQAESKARSTAAEIRQARALYSMRHRMARLEQSAWRGRPPLRPTFYGIPNAAGLFPTQPSVVVPVYIYTR